jgi:hypothetical protein
MKACVFGMPALIHERRICLFAGEDAHKHVTFVVLPKMTAHTALSVVNRLHHSPPESSVDSSNRDGVAFGAISIALHIPLKMQWVEGNRKV